MKVLKVLIGGVTIFFLFGVAVAASDSEQCRTFLSSKENHKHSHENSQCLNAADSGDSLAQYAVGMDFGFSGRPDLEEKYYRLAANQGLTDAYLSLGHSLRKDHEDEAIFWYKQFALSGAAGYGYGAKLLADLFKKRGDENQSAYWYSVCRSSSYGKSC